MQDRLRGLEIETRQGQQVGQHAQHLPGRTSLAQRLDHRMEALYSALCIDKGARGFGEWCNR